MKRFTKKKFGIVVFVIFAVCFIVSKLQVLEKPVEPIDKVTVRFVDVGQADCEIIQLPDGRNMIIDGGGNSTADELVETVRDYGIERFDYVIATHPHEDHIGGLDKIIDNFDIGCVYMPDAVTTTETFEDLLDSIEGKNVEVIQAKAGVRVIDEENISVVFVAPNSDKYEETNDYSAVAKLTYGEYGFLFTGDAEAVSEQEMLHNGTDLSADVLKVGHHGSSTSSCESFLDAIAPDYAVIEVGEDNSYGHPHKETLKALEGTKVYRTDIHGTVTMMCDGVNLDITTERE